MPQIDPGEYESLPLYVFPLVRELPLHDVWLVELEGSPRRTLQDLRGLLNAQRFRSLPPAVRGLFRLRSVLGRVFRLDPPPAQRPSGELVARLPAELAERSLVPPGTPDGPFVTLYALPSEAVYQAVNATVHAILVAALVPSASGHRFFWATYVKPVGRITNVYMRLIDPFRRRIVYPGMEVWLKRAWEEGRSR